MPPKLGGKAIPPSSTLPPGGSENVSRIGDQDCSPIASRKIAPMGRAGVETTPMSVLACARSLVTPLPGPNMGVNAFVETKLHRKTHSGHAVSATPPAQVTEISYVEPFGG